MIINGDCEDVLKTLPSKSTGLIFTSPPYFNARDYCFYNSYSDYLNKMKACFSECARVLDDGRFIVVNVSPVIQARKSRNCESKRYPIPFDFHNILSNAGFYYIDDIVWVKPDFSVPNRNGVFQQCGKPLTWKPNCVTESLLVYRKNCDFLIDKIVKNYKEEEEDRFKEKTNVWKIHPSKSKYHPAIFPEELCERVIRYYSLKGDTVLDIFAGVGTLGKVCKKMNRNFIGIDINSKYCELAERV